MIPLWEFLTTFCQQIPPHQKKVTDLRKQAIKNVTLTIKDNLTEMYATDDDDVSASESVISSEFEDSASTYPPDLPNSTST